MTNFLYTLDGEGDEGDSTPMTDTPVGDAPASEDGGAGEAETKTCNCDSATDPNCSC